MLRNELETHSNDSTIYDLLFTIYFYVTGVHLSRAGIAISGNGKEPGRELSPGSTDL